MKFEIFDNFPNIHPHTFSKGSVACCGDGYAHTSICSYMDNALREGVGIYYGMTEKKDGFMNLDDSEDKKLNSIAEGNRSRFIKNNIKGKLIVPRQVHGADVGVMHDENQEGITADGLLTAVSGVTLSITIADCFPVFFYDPVKNVVGIAHCGWRGIVKNIVKNILDEFKGSFSSNHGDIYLGIGPGIRSCHFIIKDDIIEQFSDYKDFIKNEGDGSYKADLEAIIIRQAREEGVIHIESSGICTYCELDRFFSYRRDGPPKKVMMAYIGIRQ